MASLCSSRSPDGRSLAFTSRRDGRTEIYVIDANGGALRRLTHGGASIEPAWSPDGRTVAFTSSRAGSEDIYLVSSARGPRSRRLTRTSTRTSRRRGRPWAPNRLDERSQRRCFRIEVMKADGTNRRALGMDGRGVRVASLLVAGWLQLDVSIVSAPVLAPRSSSSASTQWMRRVTHNNWLDAARVGSPPPRSRARGSMWVRGACGEGMRQATCSAGCSPIPVGISSSE